MCNSYLVSGHLAEGNFHPEITHLTLLHMHLFYSCLSFSDKLLLVVSYIAQNAFWQLWLKYE